MNTFQFAWIQSIWDYFVYIQQKKRGKRVEHEREKRGKEKRNLRINRLQKCILCVHPWTLHTPFKYQKIKVIIIMSTLSYTLFVIYDKKKSSVKRKVNSLVDNIIIKALTSLTWCQVGLLKFYNNFHFYFFKLFLVNMYSRFKNHYYVLFIISEKIKGQEQSRTIHKR